MKTGVIKRLNETAIRQHDRELTDFNDFFACGVRHLRVIQYIWRTSSTLCFANGISFATPVLLTSLVKPPCFTVPI